MPHARAFQGLGSPGWPTIENIVKFMTRTSSRDKVFRLAQFGSRLLMAVYGGKGSPRVPVALSSFHHSIVSARKVISLGNFVTELGKLSVALKALKDNKDETESPAEKRTHEVLLWLAAFGTVIYFLFDNLCFLGRYTEVLAGKVDPARMGMISARGLLLGNAVVTVLDTNNLFITAKALKQAKNADEYKAVRRQKNLLIAVLVKNLCDIAVAGYFSEFWEASPYFVGIAGTISSVIACVENWVISTATPTEPNKI